MKNTPKSDAINRLLEQSAPVVLEMLSARGKAVYFPHEGILGQSAEAKGKRYNATIGIATEEDGSPMRLSCLFEHMNLNPQEVLPYAPSFGVMALRKRWQVMIREKSPSLGSATMSLPVVTQALTHGLTVAAYLFLDEGDEIMVPTPFWGNYNLLYQTSFGASVVGFDCFNSSGGFNLVELKKMLEARRGKKVNLLLNFPNNPTGYTPTEKEMGAIHACLVSACEAGTKIIVHIDDAYFGLVYEDGVARESIFAKLATAHKNLLAVKIDGATKEDYVWGLRIGFITFAGKGLGEEACKILADKAGGSIRGLISNCSLLSQTLMLKTFEHPQYGAQKEEKFQLLRRRYEAVRDVLRHHPEYAEYFEPLPFNSGYFMCVRPAAGLDAEKVRRHLLEKYDTGIIADKGLLRVAFSSLPTADLPAVFKNMAAACRDLSS